MRMFLVGMCDIFLLLYLTAQSQVDERGLSNLTVGDYMALKTSQVQLELTSVEREKQLRDREARIAQSERDIAALKRTIQESELKSAELQRTAAAVEDLKRAVSEEQSAARVASERASAEAERAAVEIKRREEVEKRADEAAKTALERQAETERALVQQEKLEAQLQVQKIRIEQVKTASEEERKLLEERERAAQEAGKRAREEAEKAARERQEAEERARAAQAEREAALETARTARAAQREALAYAEQAVERFQGAQEIADRALKRAKEEAKESDSARTEVRAVSQSVQQAFALNVEPRLLPVELEVTSTGFLGDDTRQLHLTLIPVDVGGTTVSFVPVTLLGFEDGRRPSSLRATVRGRPVTTIFRTSSLPDVVALEIRRADVVSPLAPYNSVRSLMPTLIAVRNGADHGFGDRLREISDSRFFFPRDRLTSDGPHLLRYTATGIRGSGDFGEHIIKGDQIVDLDGRFVGIAQSTNSIAVISSLAEWTKENI